MAETAALLPVPVYPPIRAAANAYFQFQSPPGRPWRLAPQVTPTAASPTDNGTAYARDGRLRVDGHRGLLVDIYV